jgi:hypothetical protein
VIESTSDSEATEDVDDDDDDKPIVPKVKVHTKTVDTAAAENGSRPKRAAAKMAAVAIQKEAAASAPVEPKRKKMRSLTEKQNQKTMDMSK